jgi:hypothetical protein
MRGRVKAPCGQSLSPAGWNLALRAVHALTPAASLAIDKTLLVEGAVALFGASMRFRATEIEEGLSAG